METRVPDLPEPPKPKRRWLPRFSLGALLFVVLCVALGGTYATLLVRDFADKDQRFAQAAMDELPARWQELKAAVERMDPEAEGLFHQFQNMAIQANSGEALHAALGEPDQSGGGQWTLKATSGTNQIAVTVVFEGFQLRTDFDQVQGNSSSGYSEITPCPNPLRVGAHPDGFVLAAGVIGMLAGGCFGLVAWGLWCLVRRRLRPVTDTSVA